MTERILAAPRVTLYVKAGIGFRQANIIRDTDKTADEGNTVPLRRTPQAHNPKPGERISHLRLTETPSEIKSLTHS